MLKTALPDEALWRVAVEVAYARESPGGRHQEHGFVALGRKSAFPGLPTGRVASPLPSLSFRSRRSWRLLLCAPRGPLGGAGPVPGSLPALDGVNPFDQERMFRRGCAGGRAVHADTEGNTNLPCSWALRWREWRRDPGRRALGRGCSPIFSPGHKSLHYGRAVQCAWPRYLSGSSPFGF